MPSILNATTTSGLVTSADNSGSLQLQTNNGTTAVTIDTSQNVGVGTTSPNTKLEVNQAITFANIDTFGQLVVKATSGANGKLLNIGVDDTNNLSFIQSLNRGTDSNPLVLQRYGGNLLVNRTAAIASEQLGIGYDGATKQGMYITDSSSATTVTMIGFYKAGAARGSITSTSTATAYNTSSDYRLKENIAPMTGALDVVSALKPCTYTWKTDGSAGQGFIAHELQAVVPDAVTGEKDAVETYTDEDGNEQTRIKPQGVDTSFLVATLTAALQEAHGLIKDLQARVETLEAK